MNDSWFQGACFFVQTLCVIGLAYNNYRLRIMIDKLMGGLKSSIGTILECETRIKTLEAELKITKEHYECLALSNQGMIQEKLWGEKH